MASVNAMTSKNQWFVYSAFYQRIVNSMCVPHVARDARLTTGVIRSQLHEQSESRGFTCRD